MIAHIEQIRMNALVACRLRPGLKYACHSQGWCNMPRNKPLLQYMMRKYIIVEFILVIIVVVV